MEHAEITLNEEDFVFEVGYAEELIPTGLLQGDVPTGPLLGDMPTEILDYQTTPI